MNVTLTMSKPDKKAAAMFSLVVVSLQAFLVVATYAMSPGYLLPLINHPIGRLIVLGGVGWDFLGVAILLLVRPQSPVLTGLLFLAVFCIFMLPLFLVPTMGPAVLTIIQAFGPIGNGR